MSQVTVSRKHLKNLVEGRKMLFDEFSKNLTMQDENVIFKSFADLEKVSDKLSVPIRDFFVDNDLNNGVKIGRRDEGFTRTAERNGTKYYTYHHLATTKTEPNLMSLRVELHCNDPQKITLNDGHNSKEIVYVTKGKVQMDWENENGKHKDVLSIGDSAYVHPGTPHSFMALENNSELIAINY